MRVSWVSMRALVVALLVLPMHAHAQPVFVDTATLRVASGDSEVGFLNDGVAMITGWASDDEVDLHYEDEIITFDARVDLEDRETALLTTPSQAVTLEPTRAFRIEMLPATYARIVDRDRAGRVRVRLPATLPYRVASMPLGSAGTPSAPAAPSPPDDTWQSICRPTRVLSRASDSAAVWVVDGPSTRAEVGPPSHGYRPVRVWIDGYIVHGFLEHPLPTGVGCGSGTGSSSCRGTFSTVRTRLTLPAGTALYGSALATERFATLRAPHLATMTEAGAIPDAPTPWRIERDEASGARWSLEVWLRVSPEILRSYPPAPPPP